MIEKFYCINLDSRPDRWTQSQSEFVRLGLDVERFPATTGDNKPLAFNRSTYNCLKRAVDLGLECFCVFEDDVQFDGYWSAVEQALQNMPYGWDALYLGCNITTDWFKPPVPVTENLVRLCDAWQSHAIVYSKKGAQYILSQFKPDEFLIYDEWIRSTVMQEGNMYMLNPMIAYQRQSFSDIWNVAANYTGAHTQGNIILSNL